MTRRLQLRSLLWFDCVAGGVVGLVTLALSAPLARLLGLPHAVLVFTALANLAYGTYSFSLARQPQPPRRAVQVLIVANAAWTVVCVALAASLAGPGRWLGVAYLLAEGLFVGVLAAVEATVSRARQPTP